MEWKDKSRPRPNFVLLLAIRERGLTQKDYAKLVGDHRCYVNRVINGWINLDYERKLRYARALGKPVNEVFID